ncbi:MAG: alpha/beta hydrolase family protein [Verrucomicrobiota bacterium]|jgi:pimeloyl-ACP methyl ester carboxylesterase
MIAPLAKFIDWSALQTLRAIRLNSDRKRPIAASDSKLEEALNFLNGSDFIPPGSQPAHVEFDGPVNFHFPTPRPSDTPQNNVAHGRLYRCAKDWQKHSAIILLHGAGDFVNHRLRFPLLIPRCARAKYNAATLVLPYHFQRRRRPSLALDHLRRAEAVAQAVAEIRALAGWLLAEGCPAVALWGVSLGGWLSGLTACHDVRLAAVVLAVPGVRMKISDAKGQSRGRESLLAQQAACEALNRTPLNLTLHRPVIPKENILLLESTYDLFVGTEGIEELCQKWGHPEIWRLPHGHISWMFAPGSTGRVLRWLSLRLATPASHAES